MARILCCTLARLCQSSNIGCPASCLFIVHPFIAATIKKSTIPTHPAASSPSATLTAWSTQFAQRFSSWHASSILPHLQVVCVFRKRGMNYFSFKIKRNRCRVRGRKGCSQPSPSSRTSDPFFVFAVFSPKLRPFQIAFPAEFPRSG